MAQVWYVCAFVLTASIWWEPEQSTEKNWWYEEEPSTMGGNHSTQEQTHGT